MNTCVNERRTIKRAGGRATVCIGHRPQEGSSPKQQRCLCSGLSLRTAREVRQRRRVSDSSKWLKDFGLRGTRAASAILAQNTHGDWPSITFFLFLFSDCYYCSLFVRRFLLIVFSWRQCFSGLFDTVRPVSALLTASARQSFLSPLRRVCARRMRVVQALPGTVVLRTTSAVAEISGSGHQEQWQ